MPQLEPRVLFSTAPVPPG
ncbi:LEPR-XLL domain-containing protein [Dolichospermum sp. UHCC 0406]|nr:LEPR-XLL domain-containing protein [Dolichospermum sp. UHCC 0299]MTJ41036.1 LEPR-XLL domain-containing protein [Dolichospermum sp. UHCC 0406]